jgi:hypothetical protein
MNIEINGIKVGWIFRDGNPEPFLYLFVAKREVPLNLSRRHVMTRDPHLRG